MGLGCPLEADVHGDGRGDRVDGHLDLVECAILITEAKATRIISLQICLERTESQQEQIMATIRACRELHTR